MIPYEELVAGLARWRAQQGLPSGHADYLGEAQPVAFDAASLSLSAAAEYGGTADGYGDAQPVDPSAISAEEYDDAPEPVAYDESSAYEVVDDGEIIDNALDSALGEGAAGEQELGYDESATSFDANQTQEASPEASPYSSGDSAGELETYESADALEMVGEDPDASPESFAIDYGDDDDSTRSN